MSKLNTLVLAVLLFLGAATLSANEKTPKEFRGDYGFDQERMIIDQGEIFVVSTFDTQDGITVYDIFGTRLWEAKFHAKILSWRVAGNFVIVFSKDRNGHKTYLTCIDRITGTMIWQRP